MPSAPKRNSPFPYRWYLTRLSMRVRAGALDPEDREQLANLLLQLGCGVPLSEALPIRRGRPSSPEHDECIYEIAIANRPPAQGGRGLTVQKAIEEQAAKHNKSYDTIEKAWKSPRGQVIRRAVKRNAPRGYEIGPIYRPSSSLK